MTVRNFLHFSTKVGVEALRALKLACDIVGLTRHEIELIMCGNAERLLGVATRA